MTSIISVVYQDLETYNNSSHDESTLYLVEDQSLKIYFRDTQVSNVIESNEVPSSGLLPRCFYLVNSSLITRLYYSFYSQVEGTVVLVPLFDSTVSAISSSSGVAVLTETSGNQVFLVSVGQDNRLVPETVHSQVVESIGEVDLRPSWNIWE